MVKKENSALRVHSAQQDAAIKILEERIDAKAVLQDVVTKVDQILVAVKGAP